MLVGFGCNVYGRFSLAGAFNSSSGTWRCEKKYMLSKFGSRPPSSPRLTAVQWADLGNS
jgi:hypothetical protein